MCLVYVPTYTKPKTAGKNHRKVGSLVSSIIQEDAKWHRTQKTDRFTRIKAGEFAKELDTPNKRKTVTTFKDEKTTNFQTKTEGSEIHPNSRAVTALSSDQNLRSKSKQNSRTGTRYKAEQHIHKIYNNEYVIK